MCNNSQTGDPQTFNNFCNYNCNNSKSFIDSKNSFLNELNSYEKNELEELRKKVEILEDLCLPDKHRDSFVSGWYAAKLAIDENKFGVDRMEESYLQRVDDIIEEELNNLEKDDGS